MKTYSAKASDVNRKWHLIDASKYPLGRLSTEAAQLLIGKRKPMYTPNIDCGDYVVVINSDKIVASGEKMSKKKYHRHSQYPGSLKTSSLQEIVDKDSTKAIQLAVRRMLPDNKLRSGRLLRLKVYKGSEHNNNAQNPREVTLEGARQK